MARQAGLIHFRGRYLRGIADVEGGERFGVVAAGAVARLAGLAFEGVFAARAVRLHDFVRGFNKRLAYIFMAGGANLESHERGLRRRGFWRRGFDRSLRCYCRRWLLSQRRRWKQYQ